MDLLLLLLFWFIFLHLYSFILNTQVKDDGTWHIKDDQHRLPGSEPINNSMPSALPYIAYSSIRGDRSVQQFIRQKNMVLNDVSFWIGNSSTSELCSESSIIFDGNPVISLLARFRKPLALEA